MILVDLIAKCEFKTHKGKLVTNGAHLCVPLIEATRYIRQGWAETTNRIKPKGK